MVRWPSKVWKNLMGSHPLENPVAFTYLDSVPLKDGLIILRG